MKNVLFALAAASIILPIVLTSGTPKTERKSQTKTIIVEAQMSPVDNTEPKNPLRGYF
ncbi:MAG TPA: hypothetical protein VGF30_15685 [Bacteroidia bacterium]